MSHSGRTSQLFINPSVEMKEVPCRREHLHSIISKISGSVEASPSEEECTADNKYITQNDKANSELSIADDQHKPTKNMFTEENVSRTNCTKDGVSRQESPMVERPSAPYNCKPCNVGFLTQRELQLHAMCHGICISGDVKELGLKNTTIDAPDKSKASDGQGEDNESHNDKEIDSRKSPMIPKQTLLTNREARSDHNDHERLSPTYELTGATTDNPAASSVPGEPNASQDSTVNNELGYGKIVDVLSLATATRGFKEPGSIWCSLCKCSVDKGHICKINQPSFHGEKDEEGFTCELCGRYYNEKRKLRSHLRNRHKGFRLQEDEGYMCWQCWQAFPEIKILEEHIITVHGREGRRQNTTWRPCSATGILPSSGETIDNQPTEDMSTQNYAVSFGKNPNTTSLKRPGDITNEYPAKRTPQEIVYNKIVNIGEVNGKVVVNDSFLLPTKGPACPQPNSTVATSDGSMMTSDGTMVEVIKEKARYEETDTDEIEIVFVSHKKTDSDWSKQQGTMSNQPRSEPSNVSGSLVQTIKKPADSSGNVDDGPKLNEKCVTADNVDSTTGQEEPQSKEVSLQHQAGRTPYDYQRLSEQACIFCFSNFTDKKMLLTHLKTTHGWIDTFTCPICSYEGQHYLNVVEHFCKSHFHPIDVALMQSEVKCLKCDIVFQDIAHLKKHSTALHSFQIARVPRHNTFKCKNCNADFEKKFDAQKHLDAYHHFRIRYKCESCKMGFTAKYDFQEHAMYNHPELVKCFCQVCGLGFEGNADLEEHIFEMHRRKAQFFCDKCCNEFGKKNH